MKKLITTIMVTVVTTFVLFGCSNSASKLNETTSTEKSMETTAEKSMETVAEKELEITKGKKVIAQFSCFGNKSDMIYSFDNVQERVLTDGTLIHSLVKDSTINDKGYGCFAQVAYLGELVAISDKYMLFKDNVCVEIFEKVDEGNEFNEEEYPYEFMVQQNGGYHPKKRYEDLTEDEKKSFRYVVDVKEIFFETVQ